MSMKLGFYLLAVMITLETTIAAEVKITSFLYTGTRTRTAELCGKVTAKSDGPVVIDITVDPGRSNPGSYTAIPSASGKFCSVVSTESGNADVALRGSNEKVRASVSK